MNKETAVIDLLQWRVQPPEAAEESGDERVQLKDGERLEWHFPGVHLDNHWSLQGFVSVNPYSVDLRDWYGLEVEAELPEALPAGAGLLALTAEIGLLRNHSPLPEELEYVALHALVDGSGVQERGSRRRIRALLPLSKFNDPKALAGKWKYVRSVTLTASLKGVETAEPMTLRQLRFVRRAAVYAELPVRSKPATPGGTACYSVRVHNCTGVAQPVVITVERYGWETMTVSIRPEAFVLQPGKVQEITVEVEVPDRVAPGGHEVQKLTLLPGGRGEWAEELMLITLRELPHPYIKHSNAGWEAVHRKTEDYEWARALLERYEERAERWELPEPLPGPYLFETHHSHEAENAAIAWKLTGRADLADKVLRFLRATIDPEHGYPATLRACHQELVHEGEYFKHAAVVYDLLADSDLLTEEDHLRIDRSFRLFIELIDWSLRVGGISNWTLAEMIGALYCSQALQDFEWMNRFLYGTGGMTDHLSKGTLDDGWWYECSVGYNLMAAGLFSEVAQSCRPWGINLDGIWVPAQYHHQITPGGKPEIDGLCLDIWGPNRSNYRSITQLWDSLLPYADYRSVLFGINDSAESKLPGIAPRGYMDARFDLAYYLYGKPEYADVLLNCGLEDRDLLYAAEELIPSETKPYLTSASSDNAGVAVLRSQTPGREPRIQIQAAVKYGTHGGAHGHYDRVSLLSIMRYGRSFYNPESVWYSYHTFMYKFYVQTSITHNMVVVDRKQQDPAEGRSLLFHSGSVFQACMVENTARWSYPPYGGWRVAGDRTLSERLWNEGRSLPVPDDAPDYSTRTGFTEPVLQRRLTVVTDDYIALFDYVSGTEEHDYDCLFHCKGLKQLAAAEQQLVKQTGQLDPDPLGSGQFITLCDWYEMKGPVKASFLTEFKENSGEPGNRSYYNEEGPLYMDHYTLWPHEVKLIVGNAPEMQPVDKRLFYEVKGDGNTLANGQFGAWIFGREDLELAIEGMQCLELRVRTEAGIGDNGIPKAAAKTVFWGDPYLETATGRIYLSKLPLAAENTDPGNGPGVDYYGGPVRLDLKQFDKAIPANPMDTEQEGVIRVNLSGLGAFRFAASIGGDYPLGSEEDRRKVLSTRSTGTEARFITVIEPYEDQPVIISASAESADRMTVKLADGRVQILTIEGAEASGDQVHVMLEEYEADGSLLRREASQ
ncbi:hypothetical protein KDC22_23900 [Paenibacillus tritici]|uniref:COG1470 family protein n=1 Tax=Paenibacillus tritici TaxID=1873425 RepID=UPI001BA72874|nr:hypothetical protein [Paenibacillus tritici]QUL53413.1 hypothetical protein KDC22_23900 [Paenibacillus tritici]